MQSPPHAIMNFKIPPLPLSDPQVMDLTTRFTEILPAGTEDWGPWLTPVVTKKNPGKRWKRPWPTDAEGLAEVTRASIMYDSAGLRRGQTGLRIVLFRINEGVGRGASFKWEMRAHVGYSISHLNRISLVIPSPEQECALDLENLVSYFGTMIDYWNPAWASLKHRKFVGKLDEEGAGIWREGRIASAWMTYFSWEEVAKREIDLEQLSDLVEVDRREDGIMATVPGTFEEPDMDIAVKLSDLTQMPEHQ